MNAATQQVIRPIWTARLYSGKIEGIGIRYCPSIEDKVMKFPTKSGITFFEPEGLNTQEVYGTACRPACPKTFACHAPHRSGPEEAELLAGLRGRI